MIDAVAGFAQQHPDIPIRLVAAVWPGEPLDASVDVDVRLASSAPKGVSALQLTHDHIFPVCSPALAQRFKRSKKAMDWSNQTLLHSIGFEQGWSHWLLAAGTKRKMQATDLEFDSAQLCLEAAALGHGIALARSSFVADFLVGKRLVALSQLQLEAKDQVYLTMALGLSPQAPAALFRDYLLSRSPP
ncbi:MAG: hypothetical protein RJA56_874 [Pseudomonadota bacterium]